MSTKITTPLSTAIRSSLAMGDQCSISGKIYTARDAAHKRLITLIDNNQPLPIDLRGQVIYFAGPTPARPGKPMGSVGPTTSGRMDAYSPKLIEKTGLAGMIGKGSRSTAVIAAMKQFNCVYFAAIGGAGALLAKTVKQSTCVAYDDLGPEAIYELTVENFPVVVAIDTTGKDLYREGPQAFKLSQK